MKATRIISATPIATPLTILYGEPFWRPSLLLNLFVTLMPTSGLLVVAHDTFCHRLVVVGVVKVLVVVGMDEEVVVGVEVVVGIMLGGVAS